MDLFVVCCMYTVKFKSCDYRYSLENLRKLISWFLGNSIKRHRVNTSIRRLVGRRPIINPRPAGVFGRTRPAEGGGADSAPPLCLTQERVAVARWARRQKKALDEYFLRIFFNKFSEKVTCQVKVLEDP